jgi:hypothetical protein
LVGGRKQVLGPARRFPPPQALFGFLKGALGEGFRDPPQSVIAQGRDTIEAYFEAKGVDGTEGFSKVRMMLVGRGGMGKTSLLKALQSSDGTAPHINLDDRTEGVAIDAVEMGGVSCDVWDFAGQEVYYHGHKLFMTARCVYVLVTRAPVAVECVPVA